jgi:hypothetical protein
VAGYIILLTVFLTAWVLAAPLAARAVCADLANISAKRVSALETLESVVDCSNGCGVRCRGCRGGRRCWSDRVNPDLGCSDNPRSYWLSEDARINELDLANIGLGSHHGGEGDLRPSKVQQRHNYVHVHVCIIDVTSYM